MSTRRPWLASEVSRQIAAAIGPNLRLPRVHSTRASGVRRRLSGFTLVELLVVITILGILASVLLGVASVAGETAREARTRNIVARLHTLLVTHYDTYKSRRVLLRPEVEQIAGSSGPLRAQFRLAATRELLLMEMPDRWSDVLLAPVPADPATATPMWPAYIQAGQSQPFRPARTGLAQIYLRQYDRIKGAVNKITGLPNTGDDITEFQGAECLYMIIIHATGDGEARSLFSESDIGDVDGDGAPEFLDGWGRPINFLRWAPGFNSLVQVNANELGVPTDSAWIAAADADHDPFDIYRQDRKAFRLLPLIYSAGGDEEYGIRLVKPYVTWTGLNNSTAAPFAPSALDPYKNNVNTENAYLGTPDADGTSIDNVHNHLISDRTQ